MMKPSQCFATARSVTISLLESNPFRKVSACCFNCPGSRHDSSMARMSGIHGSVKHVCLECGGEVVVDFTFTSEDNPSVGKFSPSNASVNCLLNTNPTLTRDAASVCQHLKWGTRGLQGSFPELKDRMPFEEMGERKIMVQLVILLFNSIMETDGSNQMRPSCPKPLLEGSPGDFLTDASQTFALTSQQTFHQIHFCSGLHFSRFNNFTLNTVGLEIVCKQGLKRHAQIYLYFLVLIIACMNFRAELNVQIIPSAGAHNFE